MMIHLKHDKTAWWRKEHDDRCDVVVLGAEPLVIGGGCTCGAAFMDPDPVADARRTEEAEESIVCGCGKNVEEH